MRSIETYLAGAGQFTNAFACGRQFEDVSNSTDATNDSFEKAVLDSLITHYWGR